MKRLQLLTLLTLSVCLLCILPGREPLATLDETQADHEPTALSWRERYLQLGLETYKDKCSQCHDEGIDGAPILGDKESWSGRSPLWSAVLLEHAKNGYLGMPAKGGCAELSGREVEAAGEYMLSVSFPELPRD